MATHAEGETLAGILSAASKAPRASWHREQPVRIFGTGGFAKAVAEALLAEGLTIDAFIVTQPGADSFLGRPVRQWAQHESNQETPLVLGIFNRGTPFLGIAEKAQQSGYSDVRYPWDVYDRFGEKLGWRYWLSSRELLVKNATALERVHARFADEESRRCLRRIVAFRLGLDHAYSSFRHEETQYFNAVTLPPLQGRKLTYVDGGAYNGDTLGELMSLHPVERAWLFEPDPENLKALAKRSVERKWPTVNLPLGLYEKHQTLSFNAGQGEGSQIGAGGNLHITCCALDEVLPNEKVDFLKLDIEGAEVPALHGARELLRRNRPVMALSYYHRPEDLWSIPEAIDALVPDYQLYLRQHFFNSFDGVLYAVPK